MSSTELKHDDLIEEDIKIVESGNTNANTSATTTTTTATSITTNSTNNNNSNNNNNNTINTTSSTTNLSTITSGQKRLADDHGAPASKKAHIVDNEETVQVKVLIPSAAVGAIIGKGGETMRNLKSESGCRLQMSKNQELYHGTNERICLVKGKIMCVMKVIEVIMDKIKEKVDPNTPADVYDHKGVDRTKEMKLLVPNTSAGMVIGKSGARIKEIRDETGANIQVYPKAGSQEAKVSVERVITIAAEHSDILLNAIERVLEKVAADPQHALQSANSANTSAANAAISNINDHHHHHNLLIDNTPLFLNCPPNSNSNNSTSMNMNMNSTTSSAAASAATTNNTNLVNSSSSTAAAVAPLSLAALSSTPQQHHHINTHPHHQQQSHHHHLSASNNNSNNSNTANTNSHLSASQTSSFDHSSINRHSYNLLQQQQQQQQQQAPFSSYNASSTNPNIPQIWQPNQQRLLETTYGASSKDYYSNGSSSAPFKFNPMQGLGNQELLAFLDSLQSTLRTSGFNETSVAEVMQAMQVLAKYNIMGLGLGLGVAAMAQMRSNEPLASTLQPAQPLIATSRYDTTSSIAPPSLLDSSDRHYLSHSETTNKSIGGVGGVLIDVMSQNKSSSNTSSSNGPNFAATVIKEKLVDNGHVELEVPDAIVGAVLGPKAKTLAEIQHLSGCKVEVHKRGVIAAQGNRLISLSGEAECIRNGRLMIEKVINDEQARRNQQTTNHHSRGSFL